VALAAIDLLAGVIAARSRRRRFRRLAIDHSRGRASRKAGSFAVDHQRRVVKGLEQKAPHESAETTNKPPARTESPWATSASRIRRGR